jgi:Ca2+/Na+ antiporter
MGLALMALQIESMSHRRELSIALAGMISASVVPWKNSLTWLLSNIEVIGLLLIGLLVVLFRNKK